MVTLNEQFKFHVACGVTYRERNRAKEARGTEKPETEIKKEQRRCNESDCTGT